MKKFFILLSLVSLFSTTALFAQNSEPEAQAEGEAGADSAEAFAIIPQLEAEETSDIELSRTKAIFKTNQKNCRIFLNHTFQGLSKLTLSNLIEGFYFLRVEKDGYHFKEFFVYIERGKEKTFYIELDPTDETQRKQESRAQAQEAARSRTPSTVTASVPGNQENTESEPEITGTESFGDAK